MILLRCCADESHREKKETMRHDHGVSVCFVDLSLRHSRLHGNKNESESMKSGGLFCFCSFFCCGRPFSGCLQLLLTSTCMEKVKQ
jgi:hypothetical protein